MMRFVKFILFGLFTFLGFVLLNNRIAQVPPLGKFLNPFAGFWQNGRSMDALPATLKGNDLASDVHILWDDRRVPHIFAQNLKDLYFAQGYIIARDRLWQMDFQAMVAAGRLSEIIGDATVEFDRFRRRIGLAYAAEKTVEEFNGNNETREIVEAYAKGVNSYIRTLRYRSLPVEYKIFDYTPEDPPRREEWNILKSALLLKSFAHTLSFRDSELIMTLTRGVLADSLMEKIYPIVPPFLEPIIPKGTKWNFKSQNLSDRGGRIPDYVKSFVDPDWDDESVPGSNNWAISGKRSKTGYPILASDPHLNLTLPSIWYEIQLVAPGVNTYGITSPGAPGVLFGFNEKVAWGMTNAGSDVLDWYVIEFKDATRNEYFFDDEWKPTTKRIETITIRGGKSITDTVVYTHLGPVVYSEGEKPFESQIPTGAALRWTAHNPSNEIVAFLALNRANSLSEMKEALSNFDCPAQNFVFADVYGDIGIFHNGKFPIRSKGEGRFLSDGTTKESEWKGWIPRDQLPQIINPSRGFVSSANQNPTDQTYPYYLGDDYASFDRGFRINEVLSSLQNAGAEEMMALQNDRIGVHARMVLPKLLSLLDVTSLSETEKSCYDDLRTWNYEYRSDLSAPRIYESWWIEIYNLFWHDYFQMDSLHLARIRRDVTTQLLLNDQTVGTIIPGLAGKGRSIREIVNESFKSTCLKLVERFGPKGEGWFWGNARGTNIGHLGRIPGLGKRKLRTSGNFNTVNATNVSFGPSWRLIVELGKKPKAWGIYPGGQSGNPGSLHYDRFVNDWVEGKYFELLFLDSHQSDHERIIHRTIMAK